MSLRSIHRRALARSLAVLAGHFLVFTVPVALLLAGMLQLAEFTAVVSALAGLIIQFELRSRDREPKISLRLESLTIGVLGVPDPLMQPGARPRVLHTSTVWYLVAENSGGSTAHDVELLGVIVGRRAWRCRHGWKVNVPPRKSRNLASVPSRRMLEDRVIVVRYRKAPREKPVHLLARIHKGRATTVADKATYQPTRTT